MYPIASIAGGFLATLGIFSIALSSPAIMSSAPTSQVTNTADQLDRSAKSDRLIRDTLSDGRHPSGVTTVEVVGRRDTVAKKMPVKTLKEGDRERMEGCDPLVSPLAGSSLSQVAGRCIAAAETGVKLALAMR